MDHTNQRIQGIDIVAEMRQSFMDYTMSVNVSRALPDVRDGLKPVHRRILHAMNELNLAPPAAYVKCARITGDVMGKYHPHGDAAIYNAMVRMAQSFSLRYPLVDGQGNFGSLDGDPPAAQRYTEARLSRLATEMLVDIDKDTVDMTLNYDGKDNEPTVLPSRFPNLLVNGSDGIGVAMATDIPPHNLTDVINACIRRIDDMAAGEETPINALIDIIKAPDYPTGGTILGTSSIREAYRTGRGRVVLRAEAIIEPMSNDRERIVVTAIPFQVNKSELMKKIAELVNEKKVEGISDLRDESNYKGTRVVIELRRDAHAQVVLSKLYKFSQLQKSYPIIMLALVGNEPRVLNLAEMLEYYILHQKEVVTRRTQFDLAKAQRRAHLLEGRLKALDHIDEVIAIIRSSQDGNQARDRLMERFDFSIEQAQDIVDMRLRALTGLERERLEEEYAEIQKLIAELESILANESHLLSVIKDEMSTIRDRYGDERRTGIVQYTGDINPEDLIEEGQSVITLSNLGYIKRIPLDTYRSQGRGGRGIVGMQTREEDWVKDLFVASTHDYILFFTNLGRVYRLRAFEIPEAGRTARGMALVNLLNLGGGENIAAMIPVTHGDTDDQYLIMVTQEAVIKRIALSQFARINKSGLNALNIRDGDNLIAVLRSDGEREVFLATAGGKGIRFSEKQVRAMGRAATGVRGMKLNEGDRIVGATVADGQVLLVSANGIGKCTPLDAFRFQSRGGKGLVIYKPNEKTGLLVGACTVSEKDELMLINSEGVIIRIRVADISVVGRYAQGVKLINMGEGVTVMSIAKIDEEYVVEEDIDEALEEDVEAEMDNPDVLDDTDSI